MIDARGAPGLAAALARAALYCDFHILRYLRPPFQALFSPNKKSFPGNRATRLNKADYQF